MRFASLLFFGFLLLLSCHSTAPKPPQTSLPKGELSFLLGYNGQMPSEVGFLSNHVMERRLANMMKDSFQSFMNHTAFDRPVTVSNHVVAAMFFSDSDRTDASAEVIVDVDKDAVWADYILNDSTIEFAESPSALKPEVP